MEEQASYDSIGEHYEKFSNTVAQRQSELQDILNMVGDIPGKSVLDLACGYGYFGRELHQRGASKVVGIDISEKMIELAKAKSKLHGDNIEFYVQDVSKMELGEKFDIIIAAFLFHYAQSTEELESMFQAVAHHLKPSGKLIAYMASPDYELKNGNCDNYGFRILSEEPWQGRVRYHSEFLTTPPSPFTFYRWSREDYENAIKKTGLNRFYWQKPTVLEKDLKRYPEGFWDIYLQNSIHTGLVCQF
ncbi:class I SAM-dependent DNA methyltransferase [Xenorhabdus szentirmaii]|uniref:class I SAM-dependent DNA methyltransferase n=1 Tax=Xenorhabdus szentirmaii TaxID=290112 RepID=UPI00198290D6|nr:MULTISPECIES: methyltransferase domain-containing protein [unclassified Xenorhabdus]MBD2781718.1 methyltransferase domain-containing protein [Xenorhabdus sp. 38]MBD2805165.1 methyltransferase domain-containing protein [Xenorhabdus sp. ZM]MBD2826084.1 methyltransferase domain-containing protein [Xenorhabdus sp. 5]